jgi:hypothetical protein
MLAGVENGSISSVAGHPQFSASSHQRRFDQNTSFLEGYESITQVQFCFFGCGGFAVYDAKLVRSNTRASLTNIFTPVPN